MPNIGKVRIENQLVLAPMAAVSCPAFRLLCRQHGAGLIYSSMIHCNSLVNRYNSDKERCFETLIDFEEKEHPLAAQIVGSDPKYIGEAAKILSGYADIIDINFGCPDKDILANKAGAFLVKHPEQMDKILNSILDNTNLPVTAKIRTGWDEKSINALEVSKKLEDFGLSAVAIHGRTRKQGYSGKADWDIIKQVKEKISIPVIGNGDIFRPGSAKAMLEQTDCDFVMIGRASIGNPFIFSRTLYLLKHGTNCPEPSREDVKKSFFDFVKLYENQKKQKLSELRDHAMWFVKGLEKARSMKQKIMKAKDKEILLKLMGSI